MRTTSSLRGTVTTLSRSHRTTVTAPLVVHTSSPLTSSPHPLRYSSLSSSTPSSSSFLTPSRPFSRAVRSSSSSQSSSVLPSTFPVSLALRLLRACWTSPPIPSVELILNLNLDPRKPNQSVRGSTTLPHGTGQSIRIAVFAKGDKAKEAMEAGADVVGADDLMQQIQSGSINFDRCIATPDCMAIVGRVARVLGPRGLMPNPKLGTVTMNVREAIRTARQGQVTYKTEKGGVVHVLCGRLSFTPSQLEENVGQVVRAVLGARPAGAKGSFVRSAFLHATHGVSVPLDLRAEPFRGSVGMEKKGVTAGQGGGVVGKVEGEGVKAAIAG